VWRHGHTRAAQRLQRPFAARFDEPSATDRFSPLSVVGAQHHLVRSKAD
jgi:hypothetical protein